MERTRVLSSFLPSLAVAACVACGMGGVPPSEEGATVSAPPLVSGVVLQEADPSVVAVQTASMECSGVLLSSAVVLTARQCVSALSTATVCPSMTTPPLVAAQAVSVTSLSSELPGSSATGLSILVPDAPICDADIALVVLERPLFGAVTRALSATSVPAGAYVDTLGWAYRDGAPSAIHSKDHVLAIEASATSLTLAEESCDVAPGAVAIDETTGAVVGVFGLRGATCDGSADVYTQAVPFASLVETAEAAGVAVGAATSDAKKPLSIVGSVCSTFADCATSVCVSDDGASFCSEACSSDDPCPSGSKCVNLGQSSSYCVPD